MTKITVDEAFQKAVLAHQNGNLSVAKSLYLLVLEAQPTHADANHNYGILHYSQGEFVQAKSHVQKAIDTNNENKQYWFTLAEILHCIGDLKTLEKILLDAETNFGELPNKLTEILQEMKKREGENELKEPPEQLTRIFITAYTNQHFENIVASATEAMFYYPKSYAISYFLGIALAGLQHHEEAITHLIRTIELNAEFPEAYYHLARSTAAIGELEEAIGYYGKAIELNPKFDAAHRGLGQIKYTQGDYLAAEKHYMKALKINPKSSKIGLSNTLQAQGKFVEAIEIVSKLVNTKISLEELNA